MSSQKVPDPTMIFSGLSSGQSNPLDADGQNFYSQIEANCEIDKGDPNPDASTNGQSAFGPSCPIKVYTSSDTDNELTVFNSKISGTIESEQSADFDILDNADQQMAGFQGIHMEMHVSSVATNATFVSNDYNNVTSGSLYVYVKMKTKMTLLNGDPVTEDVELERKSIANHMIINMVEKVQLGADTLVIGIFKKDQETPQILVDGQPSDAAHLMSYFDMDISDLSILTN
jgi:hypothetical protein